MVKRFDSWKVPHLLSVLIIYFFTLGVLLVLLLWIVPILWRQLSSLVTELPRMLRQAEMVLMALPQKYPDLISAPQLNSLISIFQTDMTRVGKTVLSYSLA